MSPNVENPAKTPAKTRDFFISRAGEDSEWGLWIAQILLDAGRTFFLEEPNIPTGSGIPHRIIQGIDASERVIAVLSEDYLAKDYTMAELSAAFHRDPLGKNSTLILVIVRPCKIPDFIAPLARITLNDTDDLNHQILQAAL